MLESRPAPQVTELDPQSEPLRLATQAIEDNLALGLVNQTFQRYEMWRQNNHDRRWRVHDALYFGYVERKVWDGTTIERASLSIPIVFDQVETVLPIVMNALFSGDDWFDTTPRESTTPQQARDVQTQLRYVLEKAEDDFGQNAVGEIRQAVKNVLTYGNGGVMVEYDAQRQHPMVTWVDLRDIYVDPGTPSPSVDQARSLIHRRLLTIDEIDALRADPKMRIPPRSVLVNMSQNRRWTVGDQTKQQSEIQRGVQFNPALDAMLPLPADAEIEVLQYWSKSRCIWVLNREWVAFNDRNPYGFIPYCFAPCYNVVGRFYAMSLADVLEGSQFYAQALRNARLDEIHLALHPPRIRKRGAMINPGQLKWRPGVVMDVDNPKDDVVVQFPQNVTANVSEELAMIQMDAEKRTGVNALMSGIARPGNINRTATGINALTQGPLNRIQTIVSHVEDYIIVPLLYKLYRMTQVHAQVDKQLPAYDGQQYSYVDVLNFFYPVEFSVRGASKMMTKDQLQGIFPFVTQFLLAPQMVEQLGRLGKTVDFGEVLQMLQDATGVDKRYLLVRDLNDQERQAMQQPDPKTAADMQKAQMEAQIRMQVAGMKKETETMKHQLEYDAKSEETDERSSREILKLIAESMQNQGRAAQLKAAAEVDAVRQKAAVETQKNLMGLFMERQKHTQKMQQEGQKASFDRDRMMQDAATQREASRVSLDTDRRKSEQDLVYNELMGRQKLTQRAMMNQLTKRDEKIPRQRRGGEGGQRR